MDCIKIFSVLIYWINISDLLIIFLLWKLQYVYLKYQPFNEFKRVIIRVVYRIYVWGNVVLINVCIVLLKIDIVHKWIWYFIELENIVRSYAVH